MMILGGVVWSIRDSQDCPKSLNHYKLVAAGKSNKLVARELNITEGTVKVHVKHLLRKLNLRSRVEAAVWFVEQQR
ncbi:MAG: LuxR C-terminal-related transcriptional regulator [Thiothrix sp.]|uniref:LuxR C-terminal-related transcriptional regulator n=1 Tax=Thiothrix sp. TaxID=1032 RepID=UPI0026393221|nr:LuxR C-terminal-related transcriptional regulator [Thiothrix sp.]MDD5394004.1 LuxR C-terminal-related transcriptional regulator [Thiothrix sp.]